MKKIVSKRQRKNITNMKEEQEIIKKFGKGNPFKVPEGYFEDFARNIMTQLPANDDTAVEEEPTITLWQRIKPLLYMAAMFVGMIVCVRVVLGTHFNNTTVGNAGNIAAVEYSLTDFDQMSDEELTFIVESTMMDNYDLYQYLTEID